MPTTNPVPSNDPTDLLFNAQKLDQVVNGSDQYYTDRLGINRRTLAGIDASADVVLGGLGYAPPVAYASGILLTLTMQTVEYAGNTYAPKQSSLPFTTSTWATDSAKFRLIQGVAATDLAASGGAGMIGYMPEGAGAVQTTVQQQLRNLQSWVVNIQDAPFYAKGDGATDDTAAIQAALNAVSALGGGIVEAPQGQYRLTSKITIPSFVKFKGSDWLPDPSNGAQSLATSLYIDWGAGQDNHAVEMSHSSGIEGFTFFYPGQVAKTVSTPITFGFSISTPIAVSVYDNIQVKNITLYNSYKGIRLNNAGRWRVESIQGNPLQMGFTADSCYDVCYMENVHFWNFYTQGNVLEAWLSANGTAFEFRRIDQLFASKLFSWNYNYAFHCRDSLWANFSDITCDKANYPFVVEQSTQINVNGFVLIGNAAVKPAIWCRSIGESARFSNGRVTNTSAVGAQIDDGKSWQFDNIDFANPHASVACTVSSNCDVLINNCRWNIPPLGTYNVRVNGERLPNTNTAITLPTPIVAPTTITGGYQFDLSTTGAKNLQYETTYISQRNSLFVLEFDYELVGNPTTWYFQFSIKSDTGTNIQVSFEPTYALILNGSAGAAKKVRIPFFINHGRFKQIMTISAIPTVVVAGASLKMTNIVLYEQDNKYTTDAQVSMMMRNGYSLDAFGMGQTLFSKGKNRIVITQSEAGIGRPTEAPSSGAWAVGDEVRVYNPTAGGYIGYVCTAAGTPGTWKAFGFIAA